MRARDDAETVLALWESALGQAPLARGEALLRAAGVGEAGGTLGEHNRSLIALHSRLFGCEIALSSRCPNCDTPVEFATDGDALVFGMHPPMDAHSPLHFESAGHVIEFRLPRSADIATSDAADGDAFAQRLLECCVSACTHDARRVPVRDVPDSVLDALSQHMESLDPDASLRFALECPQCAAHWQATLDVAELVWKKVRCAAEQTLVDIDALARAYGWTEREVLALRPLRRAAYLQMAWA